MSIRNNHPLPQELIQLGLQKLTQARDDAMLAITHELQSLLPSMTAAMASNKEPEGIPSWAAEAFTAAGMKEGRTCWKTLQEHLTRRTAELIADAPLAEQVSGRSLATFLGASLYEIAAEGWTMMESEELNATGEAP